MTARTPTTVRAVAKVRLDALLHRRGLFESRTRAAAAVMAGSVRLGDEEGPRGQKPGQLVAEDAELSVDAPPPYVSRGGVKLANALDALEVDVAGRRALDVGASTGGFTDCLLTRGATRVHAIDVGRGQLHQKLRADPRVVVRERINARHLRAGDLGEPIDLVVIDASFIGLGKLLPAALDVLRPGGAIVAMVKPQFEVGRRDLQKGVVRDPTARTAAIDKVAAEARALGLEVLGRCDSTLAGPEGNLEAFLHVRRPLEMSQSEPPQGTTTSSR